MPQLSLITGSDPAHSLDALFVNAPLRDYDQRPRTNDYTLPVLGMAYIATYAQKAGFNVGVLDAEAHGLGIVETAELVNAARPRWAAMNLLAPTYEMSARIAASLDPAIALMVGGHHAKAMPDRVLADPRAGLVPRSEATPEHLVHVIETVAAGDGYMPPNLLGALMSEVGTLQENVLLPQGRHFSGLSAREIDVLRLVAEGHDTEVIATKLAYSERTIKNALQGVMTRYQLRNRSHAVAFAMRQGLI